MAVVPDPSDPSRSEIVVTDYDLGWPALFEQLAGPIRAVVSDLGADVQHVGSTSVPGLAAKPVIDIDIAVRSRADLPIAIERLCTLGYTDARASVVSGGLRRTRGG